MPDQQRIGIFIVAYNAESRIAQTLARIPQAIWAQITEAYVVDDCSTDETVQHAMRLKDVYPKLRVLRSRMNQRYGGNQKIGFQYAIDRGFDILVTLHADGQYAPEILPEILAPVLENRADIVLGSRMIRRQGAVKVYSFWEGVILWLLLILSIN